MNKDTKRLLDLISSIDPKGLFGNSSLKFVTIAIEDLVDFYWESHKRGQEEEIERIYTDIGKKIFDLLDKSGPAMSMDECDIDGYDCEYDCGHAAGFEQGLKCVLSILEKLDKDKIYE